MTRSASPTVGVNAWGWEPWGLPFAAGMAIHGMDDERYAPWTDDDQVEQERLYPDNQFVQNARAADDLVLLHRFARAFFCHDRPEHFVRQFGACGRPDGGLVQPHALWAMEAADLPQAPREEGC